MLRIAQQEFRYIFWSLQSLVIFVTLFGFSAMVTADGAEFQITVAGGNILINAPTMITFSMLLSSVGAIFFVPSYMANSIIKDWDSKFDAILFATPISRNDYLVGRFLGSFSALMLVMAAGPMGMLLGTFWPWAVPETLGPTNLVHYLVSYFGFLMPSMLLVSALVFAVAVMSRSMMYCYIIVVGLFIFYIVGQGSGTISPLWDPFMVRTFDDHVRYWTTAELNHNLVSFTGNILTNRLIWLGGAIFFFGLAYWRFSFRAPVKQAKAGGQTKEAGGIKHPVSAVVGFHGTAIWDKGTNFHQFWARTTFEVWAVFKSQPFILLMGFCLFLLVMTLSNREVLYEVNALPVTRILLSGMFGVLPLVLLAVTAFYGADVIWRDRENKFNEILDAVPAPNWVFVASKITALVAVIYSIVTLGVIVAVSIQALSGYSHFELGSYLEFGLLFGLNFVFLAVLAAFFQVLVKNRLFGIMLIGLFWLAMIGSMGVLGFEHPLLRYAVGSISIPLSDMNGAGRFGDAAMWLKSYYAAVAGLLVMLTYMLWNRGTLQPLRYRLKKLKAFNRPRFIVVSSMLFVLFLGAGLVVYYNVNILNKYRTSADILDWQVAYEQQYRRYENLPMPLTVDIKLNVDIYPYISRVETRGVHILENKTNTDITTVHLVFPPKLAALPQAKLEGATLVSVNALYRYYIFELEKPMMPGEQRKLEFETVIHNKGFPHRGADVTLVKNGTFFKNNRITPHIGFDREFMISDKNERRDAGLEPLARMPKLEDAESHYINGRRRDSDFVGYEATVSTAGDQIAVSSGHLQKEWKEGGRRYFRYKTDVPIMNTYSFLSAEYETLRDQWNGVDLEIFYHKPHSYNVNRMMESTQDSLAYFSKEFGPYQFKQLRILEFPAYRKLAQSFPNTIAYSEDIGFLADVRGGREIDVPYYVTAHEIAHQWWAHQVMPSNTQGAAMLSETLSQYSALMVMEHKYGKDQIRKFLKFELDSYLSERNNDAGGEVPLLRAEGQNYIHYRKGSVIMYSLKDYLGEGVVNRALQRLIEDYAFRSTPYPTSANFLAYLKEEAGPQYHGLILDFLEKITLYDVKLTDSRVEEMADGRFKVSLGLEARKFYSDGVGNQKQATFDIPVDIGLFVKSPSDTGFGANDVLMLEKRHVADGKSTIEIIMDEKPVFAGIDPYNKLIDRDSDDNLRPVDEITEAARPASERSPA